ncbi:bifunctional metallophosphatase/5'-nucleotidase [Neobacillus massiliamazoniensis]|uniref:5'-nucleotidase domain-containing protein n=1 Tax=Neobacillus massiliamazoniensis TaxID=1499688 RepID=A0A0U1NTI4_9BACI|nr:bifunctional metallophosphatase/5'-nucleotidase [Neobacillus massiliamazoniensis]CRK81275.1 5'-nucleotidase domain-containing protein [Neobacillus massiliamazoniensis]
MPAVEARCEVVILETSDLHGNVFPINYGNHEETNAGLAKIATIIQQERQKAENTLLIDNGDVLQGTPLTYHYAKFLSDKKNPLIGALNYLQYDAAIIGNHEFNYGMGLIKKAVNESDFPWLSANILDEKRTESFFGPPYVIKEFENGLRVAVLGVTTHYIPNWENPSHIEGLHFADVFETTRKWVKFLQGNETYDLLVVSYHGGFERDLSSGEPTESLTGENQGYRLCHEIEGIDVLLTGHQHRRIMENVNGITVIQPGSNGQAIGKITIQFQLDDDKWRIVGNAAELVEVDDSTATDRNVLALAEEFERQTQEWLDQTIGEIVGDMTVYSAFEVRIMDHPLIEFINRVQMDAAGVDISSTALFHNESPGFSNHVTMRDIVSNYIYPNTLKVIRISGQDLKGALEKCATYFTLDDHNQIKVNPAFAEPKPQHYNYDMWEGIEYELNISNPVGARVVKLNYHGKPVNFSNHYDVVMNNYRAGGGGDYEMFKDKPVIKDIQTDMTEILADYFLKRKTVIASCDGNWRVRV